MITSASKNDASREAIQFWRNFMQLLAEYGIFLAKVATITVAVLICIAGIFAMAAKNRLKATGKLKIKGLNKKIRKLKDECAEAIYNKKELKEYYKTNKQTDKKQKSIIKKRVFVITFNGDLRASMEKCLEQEVTAILTIATIHDEVVLSLQSGGGLVPHYGLCASQLRRIRDKNIYLTVIIDKIAASGGYLMAAVANKIIAAPFAIIGSIGVLAQMPNFHRLLKQNHIDFEQISAGQYKRTLTLFGENTDGSRLKLQSELEDIHQQFKEFILLFRPSINISSVATGEYWLGERALKLHLIDALGSTEDYLQQAINDKDIFEVQFQTKKKLSDKLNETMHDTFSLLCNLPSKKETIFF